MPDAEAIRLPVERECPFDPPGQLGDLRDNQPLKRLYFSEANDVGWLVTNHELVRAVLGDDRFSFVPGGTVFTEPTRFAILADAIHSDPAFPEAVRDRVD